MPRFLASLPRRTFLLVMLAGSALITWMSLPYFDFSELPPFVIEKLPLRYEDLWLWSLRTHVASALLSLPLCLALMTRTLQRHKAWHRWIGRVTGVLVLFALVPSGIVLSFEAKGGTPVTIGFLLSAAIVAYGMVRGIVTARKKQLVPHRYAMAHVVAQMSVAVTSRAMLVGFDTLGVDPGVAYVVALWVPVLGSALVVELLSPRSALSVSSVRSLVLSLVRPLAVNLSERIRREVLPSPAPVRAHAVVRSVPRVGR